MTVRGSLSLVLFTCYDGIERGNGDGRGELLDHVQLLSIIDPHSAHKLFPAPPCVISSFFDKVNRILLLVLASGLRSLEVTF